MPGVDELEAAKSRVSRKYLGKAGIHGVGLRRAQSAIAIYVEPGHGPELRELLPAIEREIEPHGLLVIEEGRASIT